MRLKHLLFQKLSGISPYMWSVFSILPFYFIFQSSSTKEMIKGITLTILFFLTYRLAFISKRWPVFLWTSFLIVISTTMTILFQYIYFAFYIAYLNGHLKNRAQFLTIYIVHLVFTTISINYNIVLKDELFLKQWPFIIIIWISVILLPFNIYHRKKQDLLEEQLEDANKRISQLIKQKERERIARDLHDTLGQKLSLIGLKSDLARKLIYKNPEEAKKELKDVQETARIALNEVRQIVTQMKSVRLKEEINRVKEILHASQIHILNEEEISIPTMSLFLENIFSMCLKEAINNVVKHSQATTCEIKIENNNEEISLLVCDNGIGFKEGLDSRKGNGLLGIKERLEFVNGSLEIIVNQGTTILMKVPNVVR